MEKQGPSCAVAAPPEQTGQPGDATRSCESGGSAAPPLPGKHRRTFASFVVNRRALKRLGVLAALIVVPALVAYFMMLHMPGRSFAGPLPPLSAEQGDMAARLRADVEFLASSVGKRSTFHPRAMAEGARYIIAQLQAAGYSEHEEVFVERGSRVPNIVVEVRGSSRPTEIIVIGAHYDSYQGTPGADDNASGVAATLELARHFASRPAARTLRFAFFVNEEPPAFMTADMGSWVYAKACRARNDNIIAMLSLESIGFYTSIPGYQHYPPLVGALFPDRGDWIGFIGNFASRGLVKQCIGAFRAGAEFPSEGAALPSAVPGVGWSDHWSFWQEGYPAIMITDTANYRNPHYHLDSDTPDKLDYESTARVVEGLRHVVSDLAK